MRQKTFKTKHQIEIECNCSENLKEELLKLLNDRDIATAEFIKNEVQKQLDHKKKNSVVGRFLGV